MFCGRARADVQHLVMGPRVSICDRCIGEAARSVEATSVDDLRTFPACSFCGQEHARGQYVGRHVGVRVCDPCVGLCVEILAEERAKEALPGARVVRTPKN